MGPAPSSRSTLRPPAFRTSARAGGLPYRPGDLLTDNNYNIQLGMIEFARHYDSWDKSFVLAVAAYNAGPGNISKMRKEAEKRGLDPDQWFNNVEIVTAEKIGIETTTYVRNIFKYYVSYKLTQDAQAAAAKMKQQFVPTKN